MTVYARVDAGHLAQALASVADQTRPPAELVIVADGPLTPDLDRTLELFAPPFPVRRVQLPANVGSGLASAAGLALVQAPWVARFDADDVSAAHRLERQMVAVEEAETVGRPIDVLGADMREFDDTQDRVVGVRVLPRGHEQIHKYARINSPVNNPAALLRTAAVREVGGYRHQPFMEDYDLFARLLAGGYRFANLPEALVDFRLSPAMFDRRRGLGFLRAEISMQQKLMEYGLIGWPGAVRNTVLRMGYRLLPVGLLKRSHALMFHRTRPSG